MRLIVRSPIFGTRHRFTRFVDVIGELFLFWLLWFGGLVCISLGEIGTGRRGIGAAEGPLHLGAEGHGGSITIQKDGNGMLKTMGSVVVASRSSKDLRLA